MSKSPLSGAFADSSATTKKKSKKNGAILLIAGIALTSSIGGVFAANSITIANVEFGQGVASTLSCDSAIKTVLNQAYVTGTTFRVSSADISEVDGCNNKDLVVSLVKADSTAATSTTIRVTSDSAWSSTWTIPASPEIDAADIKKITVTTK
jgi:hypothetical protein